MNWNFQLTNFNLRGYIKESPKANSSLALLRPILFLFLEENDLKNGKNQNLNIFPSHFGYSSFRVLESYLRKWSESKISGQQMTMAKNESLMKFVSKKDQMFSMY